MALKIQVCYISIFLILSLSFYQIMYLRIKFLERSDASICKQVCSNGEDCNSMRQRFSKNIFESGLSGSKG